LKGEAVIDASTEAGARAAKRLEGERIIWLTTVRADGTPQSSPVWFVWDGTEFLIYSQPGRPKLRNIEGNPRVALNLNSDEGGDDIVTVSGAARIDLGAPPVKDNPRYVEKYAESLGRFGWSPESMSADYSVPVRIRPDSARIW
jgi:PPOX class probable F420-dependent enzyme